MLSQLLFGRLMAISCFRSVDCPQVDLLIIYRNVFKVNCKNLFEGMLLSWMAFVLLAWFKLTRMA